MRIGVNRNNEIKEIEPLETTDNLTVLEMPDDILLGIDNPLDYKIFTKNNSISLVKRWEY